MPFTQPRPFLTAPEVAKILGGKANTRSVSRLCRLGRIKGKMVCNGWRILPEWLEEYMSKPDNAK